MNTEIDWECGQITTMLKDAMYSVALCTCRFDTHPCALHASEAFKVWLLASGVALVDDVQDGHMVMHKADGGVTLGSQNTDNMNMARAHYYGRIPWAMTLYPNGRELEITYIQTSNSRVETSWFEQNQRRHFWDRTHTCNLPYVQFIMAMLMPRPGLADSDTPSELLQAFADNFETSD